jgi:hypothetical protein
LQGLKTSPIPQRQPTVLHAYVRLPPIHPSVILLKPALNHPSTTTYYSYCTASRPAQSHADNDKSERVVKSKVYMNSTKARGLEDSRSICTREQRPKQNWEEGKFGLMMKTKAPK